MSQSSCLLTSAAFMEKAGGREIGLLVKGVLFPPGRGLLRLSHEGTALEKLSRPDRARIFRAAGGERLLGLIQPIENERDCYTAECHVHPESKKVLGVLD